MYYLEAIILGVIQGITEFFPISSSGHLLIGRNIFKLDDFGLIIEVSLHIGTLLAILLFWKNDLVNEFKEISNGNIKLALNIVIGSIPAALVGLLYREEIKKIFFDIYSIGYLIPIYFIMALLIYVSKFYHNNKRTNIEFFESFIIGIAQSIAIIPGFSRSGLTILAALILGVNFKYSMKFSFMLAIPILIFAGLQLFLKDYSLIFSNNDLLFFLLIGVITSSISGYFILSMLENIINKNKFWYFSFYCLLISLLLLIFVYGN